MNIPRLEHLIVVLERVHANGEFFDMNDWATKCGTASCAMGWACVDPEFMEQGLHMGKDRWGFVPVFSGEQQFDAATKFFDIAFDEADRLFHPSNYDLPPHRKNVRPRDVIARIRALIAEDAA